MPNPMLDLSLLRNGSFTALLLAGALLSAAAWAGMTYESLWLQSVLGLSPIKAGLVVLPCSLAAFAVSGSIGRIMHKTSPRLLIGSGLLVIAAGALAQAVLRADSGWAVVIPGLALVGIGATRRWRRCRPPRWRPCRTRGRAWPGSGQHLPAAGLRVRHRGAR
jgi:predicted MFS family arabinose efflux permease